ncbi:MAG: heavy metal-binding domain-containing protein [Candidatus Latescibacteria bacterium]|nr:heavy metal-binding domain-containing protein [bacterium]MBD3423576.1 heavy metal-binding domain-containing protein [Candidatus Latescibacterota bacterium]
MKFLRWLGSIAFVLGLFVTVFLGVPWHLSAEEVPLWLVISVYCILGGFLLVMITVAAERKARKPVLPETPDLEREGVLLLNTDQVYSSKVTEELGIVQGHTVFAIWLGRDLSALVRLVLGGELTEYTEMMGEARKAAAARMVEEAKKLGADAVINVRYTTNSVIGSAAELLVYGTAVKFGE